MAHVLIAMKCFFITFPFWVLVTYSATLYDEVRTNPLPNAPNTEYINLAQGLTGITSGFALAWNFFMIGPACAWHSSRALFIAGGFEFTIAGLLLAGVGLQSVYLPRTVSACDNAETWQVEGNATSLFQYYANIDNSTNPGETADVPCSSFMTSWIMSAVLGAISMASALYCLKLGVKALSKEDPLLGYKISRFFLGWVPTRVTRAFIFCIRYIGKLHRCYGTGPPGFKRGNRSSYLLHGPPERNGDKIQLVDLLRDYPIFASIASELHFSDLNNLSRANKLLRETIFPSENRTAALKLARKHCCNGVKSDCWCCGVQICQDVDCRFLLASPTANTERHLKLCAAYCSSCFRNAVCGIELGKNHKCTCDLLPDTNYSRSSQQICRSCAIEPVDGVSSSPNSNIRKSTILANKIRREKILLWRNGMDFQLKCFRCKEKIAGAGAKWWVCTSCGRECRSDMHPSWTTTTMSKKKLADASDMV